MSKQTKAGAEFYTIRVGETDVIFDGPSFEAGNLLLADFAGAEQCENCGTDVDHDNATIVDGAVRCSCGATYTAKPGAMVDGWVTDLDGRNGRNCGAPKRSACDFARGEKCATHKHNARRVA